MDLYLDPLQEQPRLQRPLCGEGMARDRRPATNPLAGGCGSQCERTHQEGSSTFLHNHRRWMQYDQYLAMGLPIGTGVVESACGSVVKPRMEGEGALESRRSRGHARGDALARKYTDNDLPVLLAVPPARRPRLYGRQPKYRPTGRLSVSHNSTQNGYAREVMDCSCLDCRCYRRAVQNNPLSERQIPLAG